MTEAAAADAPASVAADAPASAAADAPASAAADAPAAAAAGAPASAAADAPASASDAGAPPAAADEGLRMVQLPPGWEGLSIALRGDRCVVSEVPKACFSSGSFGAGAKPQVDGVSEGDEVVTINGVTPMRFIERITTAGDEWNACSSMTPPHPVGSKTKFDSPPCVACDFIRRRKSLGFDVALPMWLRAVKREMKITLGVRWFGKAESEASQEPSKLNTMATAADGAGQRRPTTSSVVELKASSASVSKMEAALERLARLTSLDDKTRKKQREVKAAGKGGEKGVKGKKNGKRPSGPNLARTRLSSELQTGEVDEWKGKYGWIKPHKPVDHPKAKEHKGRLYVHAQDLEWWVKALTPGSFCRFHVYSDANSLGAEECTELKDDSGGADAPPGEWGSTTLGEARSRSPRR